MKLFSGGYYVTSRVAREDYMDKELVPSLLLSASDCICSWQPEINYFWGQPKPSKKKHLKELNISEAEFKAIDQWITEKYTSGNYDFPSLFTSLEVAEEFRVTFLNHLPQMTIIEIGLPEPFVEEFLEDQESDSNPEDERYGIENLLLNRVPVNIRGKLLGYEVLGFDSGTFHSYLCNGLEKNYHKHFGFQLNAAGFLDSLEQAEKFCHYTNDDDLGAEPVLWLPWAVFEYTNK